MIISRRRFEAEISKAREEVSEKIYMEQNLIEMRERTERQISALENCTNDRFRSMEKTVSELKMDIAAFRMDIAGRSGRC